MKTNLYFLLAMLLLFTGCKPTNPPDDPDDKPDDPPIVTVDSLGVSISTIAFTAEKDASLIVVRTNRTWTATKTADWLTLSAASGNKNTGFLIGAAPNDGLTRETSVTIKAGDKTKEVKITQAGAPTITLTVNGVSFNMVLISGSQYSMGSSEQSDFGLSHQVAVNDFYISETETTNALWKAVRGSLPYTNHSETDKPEFPVSETTWNGIVNDFIPALNQLTGKTFRLPTEAEWEYACRAGSRTRYPHGNDPQALVRHANLFDQDAAPHWPRWRQHALAASDGHAFTAPVGSYAPNAFGVQDMLGNVWEWVSDWHGENYYAHSPRNDPRGPAQGTVRVRRGGSWHTWPFYARCSFRNWNDPDTRYTLVGLRLVRE